MCTMHFTPEVEPRPHHVRGVTPAGRYYVPRAGDAVGFAPRGWPNSCQEEASVLRGGVYPRVYDVGSITSV